MKNETRNEIEKAERTAQVIGCVLVGLSAGWLVLTGLLLAVNPTPLGLLANAIALVSFAITVIVS